MRLWLEDWGRLFGFNRSCIDNDMVLGSLASAPSLGFSIQVAQLVGAKKFNRARRVFLQSFGIVLLISIIIVPEP